MHYQNLGTSDLSVSVVGLGCNNFGGRIDQAGDPGAWSTRPLDAGITLFDTADIYGDAGGSEELLGEALEAAARRRS